MFACNRSAKSIAMSVGINNFDENRIRITEVATHFGVTQDSVRNRIEKTDISAREISKPWKFKKFKLDSRLNMAEVRLTES